MSGPKVSTYTLTYEQRARLARELRRQQQEELRRLREERRRQEEARRLEAQERERLKSECRELTSQIAVYRTQYNNAVEMAKQSKNWIDGSNLEARLVDFQNHISNFEKLSERINTASNNRQLQEILLSLKNAMQNIGVLSNNLQVLLDSVGSSYKQKLSQETFSLFSNLQEPVEINQEKNDIQVEENVISAYANKSITVLFELVDNQYLPQSYRDELKDAVARVEKAKLAGNLNAFCQIELAEIIEKSNEYIALWNEYGEEYMDKITQYEMLCKNNGTNVEILPFTSEAIKILDGLIAKQETIAKEVAEKEYIQNTLNEVMEEMGYAVLGQRDVTKRNGKHFKNELFKYDNDTAINVTYTDDGQISMELGKVDNQDRVPNNVESCYLENMMTSFCGDFKQIEERLKARGVILDKRIAMAPPSANYAQIINIEDYDVVEKQETKSEQQAAAKKLYVTE